MIAIIFTFAAYLILIVAALSTLAVIGLFIFDSITISTPKRRILQVTKK